MHLVWSTSLRADLDQGPVEGAQPIPSLLVAVYTATRVDVSEEVIFLAQKILEMPPLIVQLLDSGCQLGVVSLFVL